MSVSWYELRKKSEGRVYRFQGIKGEGFITRLSLTKFHYCSSISHLPMLDCIRKHYFHVFFLFHCVFFQNCMVEWFQQLVEWFQQLKSFDELFSDCFASFLLLLSNASLATHHSIISHSVLAFHFRAIVYRNVRSHMNLLWNARNNHLCI